MHVCLSVCLDVYKRAGNCNHMEYRVTVSGFSNKSWDLKSSLISKQWAYIGKETARLTLQEVLEMWVGSYRVPRVARQ